MGPGRGHDDAPAARAGALPAPRPAPVGPLLSREEAATRLLTPQELEEWMQSVRWTFAATMPRHPHEYSLKRWQDPRRFDRVVETIWALGYDRRYLGRPWRSLDVRDFYCWVCTEPTEGAPAPVGPTILINRARHAQRPLFGREEGR